MRIFVLFLLLLTSFGSVLATGIGVSPDSLELSSGTAKNLFVSNPNDQDITVSLSSDCEGLNIKDSLLSIPVRSVLKTEVSAPAGLACQGSVLVSFAQNESKAIGLSPSVSVRLSVRDLQQKVFAVQPLETNHAYPVRPDSFIGSFLIVIIVVIGLAAFFGIRRFISM